jgi:hypothetical protein
MQFRLRTLLIDHLGEPGRLAPPSDGNYSARMEIGLQILMADGPARVEFSPHLSPLQYEDLLGIVQAYTAGATSDDLRIDLARVANRWGVEVVVTRAATPGKP